MVTGLGNYQPIVAEDLLAWLSDSDKENDDLDDSFNILEVGIDTGELDKVRFICESIYNDDNGSNGDEDNWCSVISETWGYRTVHPVAYVSRTLQPHEQIIEQQN